MNGLVFVLLVSVAASVTSESLIHENSPQRVRTVVGQRLEIPCAVTEDFNSAIDLIRLIKKPSNNGGRVAISVAGVAYPSHERYEVRFIDSIYYWVKESAGVMDAGTYTCRIKNVESGEVHSRRIEVSILSSSVGLKWTPDLFCGSLFLLEDGSPGQCDPMGAKPCCSSAGVCGFQDYHCECDGCIDYTRTPLTKNIQ